MKCAFKTFAAFSACILFILLNKESFAQPRGMTMNQVYQQLNKQSLNNMRMMPPYFGANGVLPQFDFEVTMKDSTTQEITSPVYIDPATKRKYIVWIDKRFKRSDTVNRYKKIFPSQTLSLSYVFSAPDDNNPGRYIPATITDSCWMFKTVSGSINVYTYDGYNDLDEIDQGAIVGIQLNNGPILAYTEENLKAMVGQNAKALALIAEKKYFKAIKRYNRDMEKAAKK